MKKVLALFLIACSFLGLLVFNSAAKADSGTSVPNTMEPTATVQPISDDAVNAIAGELYCPICENVPLDVCPTQACENWRELIRQMLGEGKSAVEIKAYFSEQYGWNVLSVPPRVGLNWLIYVLPPLVIVGGAVFVVLTIRKSKKTDGMPTEKVDAANVQDLKDYLEIIDRDLKDGNRND